MSTLTNLVDEVLLNVEGYAGGDAPFAVTNATLPANGTTVTFNGGAGWMPGVVEIGDELVYVRSITDAGVASNLVRGFRGTTAVEHPAGTIARATPRFPRAQVVRAINDTLTALFPRVFAVATATFTFQPAVARYSLPAEATQVLRVEFKPTGPSEVWLPVKRWRFDTNADTATGNAIEVYEGQSGRPVRVLYAKPPAALMTGASDFTASGLPEYARDLAVYGACWRLMSFLDAARINTNTANQTVINTPIRQQTGTDLAKYYLGMFAQRQDEVATRLRLEYPAVRHFVV